MPQHRDTNIRRLWNIQVNDTFNTLLAGRVFRHDHSSLLLGSEDGVVRFYQIPTSLHSTETEKPEPILSLETKGGPIQAMVVHNVANFGSLELITADSRGTVTIFGKQQILDKRSVSDHALNSLQVDMDGAGNLAIVAGDVEGQIHAVLPFSSLWKLRIPQTKSTQRKDLKSSEGIQELLATRLYSSSSGIATNYILASDRAKNLHFIQQGSLVLTLPTSSCIKTMCSGYFMSLPDEADIPELKSGIDHQVALGGEDGTISIMSNFKISELQYTNINLPITEMLCLSSVQNDGKDSLLCSGHFNLVFLYHNGQCLAKYQTSDWVVAMSLCEAEKDGEQDIIIGCRDNTVSAIKISG
ncbi:uncharacterized protein [Diadema antillarum]|uniref:uncharacterized protein n=1 Tax=Diadema antillarum TaxID=105358 RepID=UPI003A8BC2CD